MVSASDPDASFMKNCLLVPLASLEVILKALADDMPPPMALIEVAPLSIASSFATAESNFIVVDAVVGNVGH